MSAIEDQGVKDYLYVNENMPVTSTQRIRGLRHHCLGESFNRPLESSCCLVLNMLCMAFFNIDEGREHMPLVQLPYTSLAVENLPITEVREMVSVAKLNNHKLNIIGFLCANSKYFLQSLEGDKSSVDSLYQKILQNRLHHSLVIRQCSEIEFPTFKDWSMGAVLDMERHRSIVEKYGDSEKFEPSMLSPVERLGLLTEFSKLRKAIV